MKLFWTDQAKSDLLRLYQFLAPKNEIAAEKVLLTIHAAAETLLEFPGVGTFIEAYEPNAVQRYLVGRYELHYEVVGQILYILSVWHQKEDRPI